MPASARIALLAGAGVPAAPVAVRGIVRTNLTITEPDGTTTKLNEPGARLDAAELDALTAAVLDHAATASWVVLSGSLPPGVPEDWYADVVARLRGLDCRVAVDTSDAPLAALAAAFDRAAPDLIKPNSEELAGLSGRSADDLESSVQQGNPEPVIAAARDLIGRGVGAVLATLGAAGAVLVDADGAWLATPPPITPRSTVGAGDSSLAGYVRADVAGADAADRLPELQPAAGGRVGWPGLTERADPAGAHSATGRRPGLVVTHGARTPVGCGHLDVNAR